jgi:uncharacterized protein (TIGR02594 family)
MASGGTALKLQRYTPRDDAPQYLKDAAQDIGITEFVYDAKRRKTANPVVNQWLQSVSGQPLNAMRVPWCAYWMCFRLEFCGLPSPKSGMARSFMKYGEEIDHEDSADWQVGDIVVFYRGKYDDGVLGHVALLLYWTNTHVVCLGANQGDAVSIQSFSRHEIIGVRRPRSLSKSKTARAAGGSAGSGGTAEILRHALPEPERIDKVNEAVQGSKGTFMTIAETLGVMKPWIIGFLSLLSIALAFLALYYRSVDHKEGKNA